jgi:hypothetical protein
VDTFFWKGSPNPTLVQRIAAWLVGTMFIGFGIGFILFAARERASDSWGGYAMFLLFSLGTLAVGARLIRNGFPRKTE